ncbi:hypothetical protein H0E86_29280 [Streptomyces sp. SCSIO-PteL053]|nr:hypothetical protein H0E86_29280 [Streptomyces sp. SCSIO-PteL053]
MSAVPSTRTVARAGLAASAAVVDGAQGPNKPSPCLGGQDESGTTGAPVPAVGAGAGLPAHRDEE